VGLHISIRESCGVTILDLRGKPTIDGNSEILSRRLNKLVASGVRKLLLNMTDLKQVDSSGVRVIVDAYVSLRNKAGELKLLRPRGSVLEVFRVLHLLDIIPSFDDETQALASFRAQGRAAAK
jgi:anti-sigma B factor antagonist